MTWTDLAAAQDGLVSRRQLAHLSIDEVKWLVRDGQLVHYRRGVYRVNGSPLSVWTPLRAALLAIPGAVASHRAAAGLHRFPGIRPGATEVSVFGRTTPRVPGVTAHRGNLIIPGDITVVEGFPTTTPARTLVDLAGELDPSLLERMLDRCAVDDVVACLDRLGTAGRRGSRRLQPLLAARVGGDSPLEQLWLRRLRRAGLPSPIVGFQLVVSGRVLVLDMAWPEHRVAVEVDGWSAHGTRTQFDRDRERDLLATRAGWRILRVTSRTPLGEVTATLHSLFSQK